LESEQVLIVARCGQLGLLGGGIVLTGFGLVAIEEGHDDGWQG
jgi:hypothetical protein